MSRASLKRSAPGPTSVALHPSRSQDAPAGDAAEEALARAGRLLARRPRTEAELRHRLTDAGLSEDAVAAALERLRALRLVDDEAFARQWVEERARTRPRSGAALRAELHAKGIAGEVAESAVAGFDDEAQALALAERSLPRLAGNSPSVQALKLHRLLLRRGFDAAVAERTARALLPPEGWD